MSKKPINEIKNSQLSKTLNISKELQNLDIKILLKTMNKRIQKLYNRQHMISHSYFENLQNLKDEDLAKELADIFINRIIPLLKVYFKNDWEKIRIVLGDTLKTNHKEKYQFIKRTEVFKYEYLSETMVSYELNKEAFFHLDSYITIYE